MDVLSVLYGGRAPPPAKHRIADLWLSVAQRIEQVNRQQAGTTWLLPVCRGLDAMAELIVVEADEPSPLLPACIEYVLRHGVARRLCLAALLPATAWLLAPTLRFLASVAGAGARRPGGRVGEDPLLGSWRDFLEPSLSVLAAAVKQLPVDEEAVPPGPPGIHMRLLANSAAQLASALTVSGAPQVGAVLEEKGGKPRSAPELVPGAALLETSLLLLGRRQESAPSSGVAFAEAVCAAASGVPASPPHDSSVSYTGDFACDALGNLLCDARMAGLVSEVAGVVARASVNLMRDLLSEASVCGDDAKRAAFLQRLPPRVRLCATALAHPHQAVASATRARFVDGCWRPLVPPLVSGDRTYLWHVSLLAGSQFEPVRTQACRLVLRDDDARSHLLRRAAEAPAQEAVVALRTLLCCLRSVPREAAAMLLSQGPVPPPDPGTAKLLAGLFAGVTEELFHPAVTAALDAGEPGVGGQASSGWWPFGSSVARPPSGHVPAVGRAELADAHTALLRIRMAAEAESRNPGPEWDARPHFSAREPSLCDVAASRIFGFACRAAAGRDDEVGEEHLVFLAVDALTTVLAASAALGAPGIASALLPSSVPSARAPLKPALMTLKDLADKRNRADPAALRISLLDAQSGCGATDALSRILVAVEHWRRLLKALRLAVLHVDSVRRVRLPPEDMPAPSPPAAAARNADRRAAAAEASPLSLAASPSPAEPGRCARPATVAPAAGRRRRPSR